MRYTVEIYASAYSDVDASRSVITDIESLPDYEVISVKPSNPNDALLTVSYSAEAIRQHLEDAVEDADENMKLLHLVTDGELEEIAITEFISSQEHYDQMHENMVGILEAATEGPKRREKFEEEKGFLIANLVEIGEDRKVWDAMEWGEDARSDIKNLFKDSLCPTPEQVASRAMVALRDLATANRETVERLLDWAATDLNAKGDTK